MLATPEGETSVTHAHTTDLAERLQRSAPAIAPATWAGFVTRWGPDHAARLADQPVYLKLLYLSEMLPLPFPLKLWMSHLFYVLAEK